MARCLWCRLAAIWVLFTARGGHDWHGLRRPQCLEIIPHPDLLVAAQSLLIELAEEPTAAQGAARLGLRVQLAGQA